MLINQQILLQYTAYCNAYFDNFLCWEPTPAGTTAKQFCPLSRISDPSKLVIRTCGKNGFWTGRHHNESNSAGWTNYTPCFISDTKFEIARNTRQLEISALAISMSSLFISLLILKYFRSLRNYHTRIHKNLYIAMLLQIAIQLVIYIDQEYIQKSKNDPSNETFLTSGIENMPYVCECLYVLLEYGISAMFLWVYLEGLYLKNLVSTNTLKDQGSPVLHLILGWGIPFIQTMVWAVVTSLNDGTEKVKICWYGYNYENSFWIMQAPRLIIIVVNFVMLLQVLNFLITKMHQRKPDEMARLRKAARAMFFLLPLLGITNGLDMVEPSLRSVYLLPTWIYFAHCLRSLQGFFIALFYCLLNGEVQTAVKKYYANKRAIRERRRRQRALFRGDGVPTPPPRPRTTLRAHTRVNRSTNTDTDTASPIPFTNPHAALTHTVATIEHERPIPMHEFPCRSVARIMRPECHSCKADSRT